VAKGLLAFAVLVLDARGLGEAGSQVMRGAGLEGLAVLHHRFDRVGRDRARKALVLGLLAGEDRHGQRPFGEGAVHLECAQRLGHRVVAVSVGRVALLPEELAGSQEHARAHFPAHDVGPLVGQ
jgi:hypothetical protein